MNEDEVEHWGYEEHRTLYELGEGDDELGVLTRHECAAFVVAAAIESQRSLHRCKQEHCNPGSARRDVAQVDVHRGRENECYGVVEAHFLPFRETAGTVTHNNYV